MFTAFKRLFGLTLLLTLLLALALPAGGASAAPARKQRRQA